MVSRNAIVLHHSALELIGDLPWKSVATHPAVVNAATRRSKDPAEILFDLSGHHSAVRAYPVESRGRPDLVHAVIMAVLFTPAFYHGLCELWIHTRNDLFFPVPRGWRVPVNYNRFVGLVEVLFQRRELPLVIDGQKHRINVQSGTLQTLLKRLAPTVVVEWAVDAPRWKVEDETFVTGVRTAVLIGGYQKGNVSVSPYRSARHLRRSLFDFPSTAWAVAARTCVFIEQWD